MEEIFKRRITTKCSFLILMACNQDEISQAFHVQHLSHITFLFCCMPLCTIRMYVSHFVNHLYFSSQRVLNFVHTAKINFPFIIKVLLFLTRKNLPQYYFMVYYVGETSLPNMLLVSFLN